jgi:pimeloyl-ACP methyl ester carboxylesterase
MKNLLTLAIILLVSASIFGLEKNDNFADFNGKKVYFKSFGKGKKAIVLIHGWTCNADFWRESFNAFPEFRVIAVDLIGHGRSDKPKTDYTMEYFAKSIEAVMKKAKIKEAVLVGHSMGTPVIRQFYRLYPKQTLGLVIVDGGLRPFGTKAMRDQFMAPLRADYKANSLRFIEGMIMPIKDENLKQTIRNSMAATPDYVALSAMDGMGDETLYKTDAINVPVLAVLAESTFGQQKDIEQFLRSMMPNLNFQMWKGVSHFLMMEKPKEFNAEVKAFVVKNKLL